MRSPNRVSRQAWFGPLCLFAGCSAFAIQARFYLERGFFSWKLTGAALALCIVGACATFYTFDDWRKVGSPADEPRDEEPTPEEFNRRFED